MPSLTTKVLEEEEVTLTLDLKPIANDDDEWEDITSNLEDIPEEEIAEDMDKSGVERDHSPYQCHPKVKRRVKALKKLQLQGKMIDAKFYEEMRQIEAKYEDGELGQLSTKRAELVKGDLTDPTNPGIPGVSKALLSTFKQLRRNFMVCLAVCRVLASCYAELPVTEGPYPVPRRSTARPLEGCQD